MGGSPSSPLLPLSRDRIVVVTGASSGLGYEIAKWVAMQGATVILACRSEEKTRQKMEQMQSEFRAEKAMGLKGITESDTLALEFIKLDLNSFKSVLEFVDTFRKSGHKLHVLFCNAGYGMCPYSKSDDGLEKTLQVNYLGHFLLTAKLLPIMKTSGPDCRLLHMSSLSEGMAHFDMDTINYQGRPEKFPEFDYYGRSKLYQIMQMYSMVERLQGTDITVNTVQPGVADTGFVNNDLTCLARCVIACLCCVRKDATTAAKCSIDCVVNPKLAGVTGVYYGHFKTEQPSAVARNKDKQQLLWTKTFELLQPYLTEEDIQVMEGH